MYEHLCYDILYMYAFLSLLELHTYVTLYDLVTAAGTILRQRKEIPQLRVEEIL